MPGFAAGGDLDGAWVLTRLVWDFTLSRWQRGTGWVNFAEWAPGRFQCREDLFFAGNPARRMTLWDVSTGRIDIHYADGYPLVGLDLSATPCEGEHLCGEDLYRARLKSIDPTRFVLGWRVTGPRKDYAMVTDYRRMAR